MIQMVRSFLFLHFVPPTNSSCPFLIPSTVYALPLLSSFLDLAGQLMLVGAFSLARKFAPASTSIIEGLTNGLEVASDALY